MRKRRITGTLIFLLIFAEFHTSIPDLCKGGFRVRHIDPSGVMNICMNMTPIFIEKQF